MITNPKNYAEWCKVFDEIDRWEIGHSDINLDNVLAQGKMKWVSGVAERFTNRLLDLINSRFSKLNKFYDDRCSKYLNSFEFSKTLISFRKELLFLMRLTEISFLPDDLKQKLQDNILEFAHNAQQDLEDGAKGDLSGEMQRIVLGNRIDNL